jgi:hypothetical protein
VIWAVLDCEYAGEAPIPAAAQIVIAAILRRTFRAMPNLLDQARMRNMIVEHQQKEAC